MVDFGELVEEFTVKRPSELQAEMESLHKKNYSSFYLDFYDELPSSNQPNDPEYEQFLADVWVGIVLTLMVLCCVCCMCSCLLYHKFQQWKRSVEERRREDLEASVADSESLPSYTLVSGLPTYEEALEQLKKVGDVTKPTVSTSGCETPRRSSGGLQKLSVMDLFQLHKDKTNSSSGNVKI